MNPQTQRSRQTFKLFLISLILLSGCASDRNKVVITGEFTGRIPEQIISTVPVNGAVHISFQERENLYPNENFTIVRRTDRPAFVSFIYYASPPLIIEPGQKYNLHLNFDPSVGFEMGGELSDVQLFYNSFNHESPRSCIYDYADDISNYAIVNEGLLADLQIEMEMIDDFYSSGQLSREVYELIKTDRQLYYQVARTVVASANYLRFMSDTREVPGEIIDLWHDATKAVPTENPYFFTSYNAFDYLLFTYWYHVYTSPDFDYDDFVKTRSEKREALQVHAHTLSYAESIFSGKTLEFFKAAYIGEQSGAVRQPQDELPVVIEKFRQDYPNSDYLIFLDRISESVKKRLAAG